MINKSYSNFFKALSKNNHKEWFHANKKKYESDVKQPFMDLLDQIIPELKKFEPEISDQAKDALFRINKDFRFSKDKTPYQTIMKAGFSPGGKKSFLPGFYLGISSDEIHVGGGLFMVQSPELDKIRRTIMKKSEAFLDIVRDKDFVSTFGELLGDKSKRYDKELMEAAKENPYIAYKQFYAMADLPLEPHYDSEDLSKLIMEYFRKINELNQFLKAAF